MSKEDLKKAFLVKPRPKINTSLQSYEPPISSPASFEFVFNINDPHTIIPSDGYKCVQQYQEYYIENLSSIKENAKRVRLKRKIDEISAEKRQEKETKKWIKKMEKLESINKNCVWVWTNEGHKYVTESFLEESDAKLFIRPRFLTDSERYKKSGTPPSKFVTYNFRSVKDKVLDPQGETVRYRSDQVWSLHELKVFLHEFFHHPKKFDEIKKFLPEKTTKDVIQLFYLIKYQFRLKKMLRIQSRKRREDVVIDHVNQVIKKVKKMFPKREWISQEDFSHKISQQKEMSPEKYIEKFGKDSSKLNPSQREFQDYSRYKEYAFGGETMQDEGPIAGEEAERKGVAQWSYEEKLNFLTYYRQFGRNWEEIAKKIETKTASQCRNFFQNYKKKLNLDSVSSEQDAEATLAAAGIVNRASKN
ncbi:unnamed protein product [Blepharisma stoltei]|uniref:Uncharacterized protein n=1 Tax=Blepharisma stoltei TaxID=1481888 RepID=A0AAU9K4J2_9CILI|nr:unnamed protein product [Blepharisma stoltei]